MRFVIHKPTRFIKIFRAAEKHNIAYTDTEYLYQLLPSIIHQLGVEHLILDDEEIRHYQRQPNDILLSWHSRGEKRNTWHIKPGYLPNQFYFDRRGFSGWSELAITYTPPVLDVNRIKSTCSYHIENNNTRFPGFRPGGVHSVPYVLVLDQRNDDVVSDLAYIKNLPARVSDAFANTKYNVVIRPHPLQITYKNQTPSFMLKEIGSIHDDIANAAAIYTVNSSSGFESLLHCKHVFTAGVCDYHWATTTIKSQTDLKNSVNVIDAPVNETKILQFLQYCFDNYFMTTLNPETIKQKLVTAIEEFTAQVIL